MQITSRGSRYTVREATIDSRSKKSQPEPMYLNGWNPDPNEFAWGLPGAVVKKSLLSLRLEVLNGSPQQVHFNLSKDSILLGSPTPSHLMK